ncbi:MULTISPECIES: DUF2939 domain-containing protein [unclassified Bradyrhizobium]|uniref:DUF2939 domain-containing protein n=1 Tax=unclassified Bradyrhizobium TaxID=2631580 RepID=UPI000378D627|nr:MULTISPECIES: DUF2939 domain-containing protein [unclassified Bradyrhizobium]MCK1323846.1 DUF2939 domain-containing protein [Bradyrhizobium sp. 156]MCK1354932.1 DUF2939 domain-containing protein [Bradyrhizobium sp. CW7]MCK1412393.1 DUF2939 domain-containing protein [Bradyrhizobium sp. CW4]MCK1496925.1 DUF2939 domain-containing protein [Bradyrhizobium sp. 188]MCK1568456.1 DUF2939 domain-containing protein [Bradyrhizobium sp. 173]
MRWLIGILAAFLICLFIYAGSAFVSVLGLVSAVRSADAAQVIVRTNLPRVRHSIVDQIVSAYLDRIGQRRPVRPFERMAIKAFGATIADDLAVKLMTPENLSVLLSSGNIRTQQKTSRLGRCRRWPSSAFRTSLFSPDG